MGENRRREKAKRGAKKGGRGKMKGGRRDERGVQGGRGPGRGGREEPGTGRAGEEGRGGPRRKKAKNINEVELRVTDFVCQADTVCSLRTYIEWPSFVCQADTVSSLRTYRSENAGALPSQRHMATSEADARNCSCAVRSVAAQAMEQQQPNSRQCPLAVEP